MLVRLPTLLDLGVQPLSGPSRVLLCGEADFSYAAALCATQRGAIEVTATAFEEEMELHERYPRAAEALARVRAAGARCDFGVDARELSRRYPSEEWDRVVFNLPQAPPEPRRRNQIQRQRALLRDFCAAAASAIPIPPLQLPLSEPGRKDLLGAARPPSNWSGAVRHSRVSCPCRLGAEQVQSTA